MELDRTKFFAAVRPLFGGRLLQAQVAGMDALLDAAPRDMAPAALAYCFATAFHETDRTMQPIKENGGTAYFTRMYDPKGERPQVAATLGNIFPGDGAKFAGRGFVQLTGRSNYARAAGITGENLVDNPDEAMRCDLAARIMFGGMTAGWFTGKKLADYFGPGRSDPVDARRIINGTDKAATIAGYHAAFLAALQAGAVAAGQPAPARPPDPPRPTVIAAPTTPPQGGFSLPAAPVAAPKPPGLWERFTAVLTTLSKGQNT